MLLEKYLNDFNAYADELASLYQNQVAISSFMPRQKRLWQLEIAMHRMESQLNSKKAEIAGYVETMTGNCEEDFYLKLSEISTGAIKGFLQRNLQSSGKSRSQEKISLLG